MEVRILNKILKIISYICFQHSVTISKPNKIIESNKIEYFSQLNNN